MLSIWQQQSFYNQSSDILIVGAGLTGLLSAIKFKRARPSLSVTIIEKGSYPLGASAKNAGFACFGSPSEILDDVDKEGEDKAYSRVEQRWSGLQELISLAGESAIDLKKENGFELFGHNEVEILSHSREALPEINAKMKALISQSPYSIVHETHGMNIYPEMIEINGEASLDSGLLLQRLISLARESGVKMIFNHSVNSFNQINGSWQIESQNLKLKCDALILATNGFTPDLYQTSEIVPGRGQIILTEPIPDLKLRGNYHLHQGYFYFRVYNQRLLLGGGRHLDRANEQTTSQQTSPKIQDALQDLIREVILPDRKFRVAQRWAGTMAFGSGNEKDPIVKKTDEGFYIAARLGGMGVAMAPKVADRLTDLLI